MNQHSVNAGSSTYLGEGWQARTAEHRADVAAGILWHQCGSNSEHGPLLEVALARPQAGWFPGGNPQDHLMWAWPDVGRLQSQAASIGAFYESRGITVRWMDPGPSAPGNFLFQRDLFFMTPEGAVLARPAGQQRAAEARFAAAALSALGVPILATPRGDAVFEGADALWLDANNVLIGTGIRTNASGAGLLTAVLGEMGVRSINTSLEGAVQHLLGAVNFISNDLAAVRADRATPQLIGVLQEFGYEPLLCVPDEEVTEGLGMNFVALASRDLVMPAGCPHTRDQFRNAGVVVHEIEISEYRKAAGGLGCLTGIIRRQPTAKERVRL